MLHNQFHGSIDNFGATISDANIGTSVPAHASANTKGADTSLIAGASVTHDVYGIFLGAAGGNVAGSDFGFLADLLIDPDGGTTWSVLVNNLLFSNPHLVRGLYRYYFPLRLKAGTSIGMRQQCSTGAQAMRMAVKLMIKPTRPELIRTGFKVETIGAVTASSTGQAITPGANAVGSWATIGTLTGEPWFWQCGARFQDTTLTMGSCIFDLALGDATNKRIAHTTTILNDSTERVGKEAIGDYPPLMQGFAGETCYMRGTAGSTADSTCTGVAYGVI